jgi:hypothetical protein
MLTFIDAMYVPYIAAFLFVFAIIFGVLNYAKVLGFSRNVNAAVAAVIAFFATAYEPFVMGMQEYMPIIAAIFVVIFFVLFLKKIFGKDDKSKPRDSLPIALALAILLLVIGIFWDRISQYIPLEFDASNALWIIGLIIIVAIFWIAYTHESGGQAKPGATT